MSANLPGGTGHPGQHDLPRNQSLSAVGAYLWVDTGDDPITTMALDRTGAQRLSPAPGRVLAVNEDWLVTADWYKFTVYRLS